MWKECICGNDCNSYLESFFNSISEGFAFHQLIRDENNTPVDCEFLEVNDAFIAITGLNHEDIVGRRVSDLTPDLGQFWLDIYEKISMTGIPANFEKYNKELDRHFKVSCFSQVKDQFTVFLTDITDLKKANEIMKKHQVLFDIAQDIIFYADGKGKIIDANRNAILKYGYSLGELTKLNVQDLRHDSIKGLFKDQMKEADKCGITFEGLHVMKDGTSFPVEVSVKSVLADENRLRIHIVRDITERKVAEERIVYLANHDSLTGIPNRSYLMSHLNSTLENASRGNFKFALMLFDIDKFKKINDVYGHDYGDIVLKKTAEIVQGTIRKVDFIARLGGDEFVIVQPYINGSEDCSILAKRIIDELKTPIKLEKAELKIDLSIGIAVYPEDSMDSESLMRFSDIAMYAAKQIPGASFEFYSNLKK